MPRCGCEPEDAGRLADLAPRPRAWRCAASWATRATSCASSRARTSRCASAGEALLRALADVGGDVVSGGGTGTWTTNDWATELQAGSYCLMDTEYVPHAPEFANALSLWCTVISANEHWGVVDGGLKGLGMDHGDPTVVDVGDCWFVSDEHTTFGWREGQRVPVGEQGPHPPAHVDPTVA